MGLEGKSCPLDNPPTSEMSAWISFIVSQKDCSMGLVYEWNSTHAGIWQKFLWWHQREKALSFFVFYRAFWSSLSLGRKLCGKEELPLFLPLHPFVVTPHHLHLLLQHCLRRPEWVGLVLKGGHWTKSLERHLGKEERKGGGWGKKASTLGVINNCRLNTLYFHSIQNPWRSAFWVRWKKLQGHIFSASG